MKAVSDFSPKNILKVTRNRYKLSTWPSSKKKKVTEFHPVSSRDLTSIISEFQTDEILCILYVQEMHILFFSANYSFNNISTPE